MLHPDIVLKNACVYTVDPGYSTSEAIVVLNGKFAVVGMNADIENITGPGTRVIEAGGKTVAPGFIDAHCHSLSLECKNLLQIDCSPDNVSSIEELVAALGIPREYLTKSYLEMLLEETGARR